MEELMNNCFINNEYKEFCYIDKLDDIRRKDLLDKLEKFDNTDPEIMEIFNKAKWLQKNGFHREAIDKFTSIIKYASNNPRLLHLIYLRRAISYDWLKEEIYAFADGYRAVRIFEYDIGSFETFILICEKLRQFEEIIKCFSIMYKLTKDKLYIENAKISKKNQKDVEYIMHHKKFNLECSKNDFFTFKSIKLNNTKIIDNVSFFKKMNTKKIKFKENEIFGRFLVAAKDLKAGEEIFTDYPLVSSIMEEGKCDVCFASLGNEFHTTDLKEENYCSIKCKEKAYNTYYKFLQGRNIHLIKNKMIEDGCSNLEDIQFDMLVVKIYGTIQQNELEAEILCDRDMDYATKINHLHIRNKNEICNGDIWCRFLFLKEHLNLMDNESFNFQFYDKTYNKVVNNSKATKKPDSESTSYLLSDFLGTSIYFYSSFLNHSCDANAEWATDEKELIKEIVKAKRDIKKGEQIFINIVPENTTFKEIKFIMGFDCTCSKCTKDTSVKNKKLSTSKSNESNESKEVELESIKF